MKTSKSFKKSSLKKKNLLSPRDAEDILDKYASVFSHEELESIKNYLLGSQKTLFLFNSKAFTSRKNEIKSLRKKIKSLDDQVSAHYMNLLEKYRGNYDSDTNTITKKLFDEMYNEKKYLQEEFLKRSSDILVAGSI